MASNTEHDLHSFMSQITAEMACEYKRIVQRTREDPGTAGDEGEENWAELLRGWLPYGYRVVTKGRLIGHDGTTTPQIDVLVLKPSYPAKLVNKKMYLAAGVAAAFECKTTLRGSHLKKTTETAIKVKDLFETRVGSPYKELHAPIIYGVLAHSHGWKSKNSIPLISECLSKHSESLVTHPRQMLDLICVSDIACWSRMSITFPDSKHPGAQRQQSSQQDLPNNSVISGFSCAAYTGGFLPQVASFTPIGCLIGLLIGKIAWEDPGCRDMADYYRLANLSGSSNGELRSWANNTIYSDLVYKGVVGGKLVQGVAWNEWCGIFS